MKPTLRMAGLAGALLFAGLFALTFALPDTVERAGQEFIKYQVQKEVRERYGEIAGSSYGKALGKLKSRYKTEARQIQAALNDNLPARIANVVAAMCRLDCKQRQSLQDSIEAGYRARLASTGTALDTLTELIRGKYLEILGNLKRDVRVFLGSNTALFLLVVVLALAKPAAAMHLYVPAVLLMLSTIVSAAVYLFGQNWFFTILYNSYVGFGYIAYAGALFGFLCDIALNKARITTGIVNAILRSVGSAAQAVPC